MHCMASRDSEQGGDDSEDACEIEKCHHIVLSGHQAVNIDRRYFAFSFAFILTADGYASDAPEVVSRILSWTINHEIRLFVNEVLPLVFAHLEIWCELNRICG